MEAVCNSRQNLKLQFLVSIFRHGDRTPVLLLPDHPQNKYWTEGTGALTKILRHGARAPLRFLPDDPQSDLWPEGSGSLTKAGKVQAFNLGKILRQRYNEFLGEKYNAQNVHVRSVDLDRCLMSAQCCLAGMFPPTEDETFVKDLKWQPIPIHTKPSTHDEFHVKHPEVLQKPPEGVYKDSTHKKFCETIEKHKDLLSIADHIGKCNNNLTLQLGTADALLLMYEQNLSIPNAIQNRIEDYIKLCTGQFLLFCIYNSEVYQPAGKLFNEIIHNIENQTVTGQSPTKSKTFIYSMNDVHIIALIHALTKQSLLCPLAACLMLEFYQRTENPSEFCVKVLFLRDHNEDPMGMTVSGQKEATCSFENFKKVAEKFINIDSPKD